VGLSDPKGSLGGRSGSARWIIARAKAWSGIRTATVGPADRISGKDELRGITSGKRSRPEAVGQDLGGRRQVWRDQVSCPWRRSGWDGFG